MIFDVVGWRLVVLWSHVFDFAHKASQRKSY